MSGKIVPFGKYKGQEVEVMLRDVEYVDWLLAQPWFRAEFKTWWKRITKDVQASETPQHNALQARFLRPEFRFALVRQFWNASYDIQPEYLKVSFEYFGFDVRVWDAVNEDRWFAKLPAENPPPRWWPDLAVEIKPTVADEYPVVLRQMQKAMHQRQYNQFILLVGEYLGVGATTDEFIAIFEASGVKVVFLDEVEALITKT